KHSEAEMIAALKQVEAGRKVEDVAREVGVSKHTIYGWKAKYGGLEGNEAQRLRQLGDENGGVKKLVGDLSLGREVVKAVIAKNGLSSYTEGRTPAGCGSTTHSASAGFAGCCRWRSAVIAISRARTTMSYASGWCSWRGRSRASANGA